MRRSAAFVVPLLPILTFASLQGHSQSCPIAIKEVDPRDAVVPQPANSTSPYLKIVAHNDPGVMIDQLVYEVHFPGAWGEFTSKHAIPPGANDSSVWADGAFIRNIGVAMDLDVRAEKIVFANGTTWLDDGSHTCSKLFSATAAGPLVETAERAVKIEPSARMNQTQDLSTPKLPVSLLVPSIGNARAEEDGPVHIRQETAATETKLPPLPVEKHQTVDFEMQKNELIRIDIEGFPIPPQCPVQGDYLDRGREGRIYTTIRNQSDKAIESIEFTISSGVTSQTIQETTELLSGKERTESWHAAPPSQGEEPTSLQIAKVVFSDGGTWADAGKGTCTVSANSRTAVNNPTVTSSPAPAVPLPRLPPPTVRQTPLPQIIKGSETPQATPSGGKLEGVKGPEARPDSATPASSVVEVTEAATPEAMRRDAPLITRNKASICTVATIPAGATVSLDGKRIGEAPLVFVVLQKEQARQIRIALPGYHPVLYQMFPDGDPVPVTVHLQAEEGKPPAQVQQ
jgi:hypothetical protein